MDVTITTIRHNKGTARVWLQGNTLLRNGFVQGTKYKRVTKDGSIVLTRADDTVVLTHLEDGVKLREVSGRFRNDKHVPIIDINNDEIAKMFEGMTRLRVIFQEGKIVILPLASEIRAKARVDRAKARMAAGKPLKMGSFAHGGGVLSHALEAGFAEVGVATKLMVANEYREDLMDHVMAHNSAWSADTISLCGPMQEFAYDANLMQMVATHIGDDGELDVLEAGLPCSGASIAGRAKRGLANAESHPEVGHLIAPFIALLARLNASTVILENVPQYQNTASMDILRNSLRDLCYDVHEIVVNGGEWNAMEHRERMVMVAVTRGMSFDFANLKRPARVERQLSEILEDIPLDHPSWSEMSGLKAKEVRDKDAGKFFTMQIFDGNSVKINTLTKGIAKNRSTDPKIQHPFNPNLLRVPTSVEHARAKDIPEELIEGMCATTAHELLGQSINYKPFVSVGKLLGASYKSLRSDDFVLELQAKLLTDAVLARAKQMARHKMH